MADLKSIQQDLLELIKDCENYELSVQGETQWYFRQLKNKLEKMEQSFHQSEGELSPREKEILSHVANGFTNREIASALSVSEKTIEYHMKSIFTKTGSSKRTEAATYALKKGLL